MNAMLPNGDSHRLFQVSDGGAVQGQRLGVCPADLPSDTPTAGLPALLTLDAAGGELRLAVRLVPVAAVPSGVVALGGELAAETGLDDLADVSRWSLGQVPVVPLRRVRLESASEATADEAAAALTDARLPGRLLWVPAAEDETWLTVGELPYRVSVLDSGERRDVLAEFGRDTDVELFVSGARRGVDMVVLADCSGSMLVPDIPADDLLGEAGPDEPAGWTPPPPPGRRPPKKERAQALRESLRYLLEERRRLRGRTSRIALMEFTDSAWQVFPRGGGMSDFDADSPASLVAEFEAAVADIRPIRLARTDIGNALHEAANVLHRYGAPGNEKRIVLISDGGDWRPKGDQGLGEVVQAIQEPVSLMEHLHRDSGIRVHAVGISTEGLYRAWLAEGNHDGKGLSPDHLLLRELSRVGGGDAAAIGGLGVLVREFSELGAGTSRRVVLSEGPAVGGTVSPAAAEALRALGDRQRDVTSTRPRAGTSVPAPFGATGPGAEAGRIVEASMKADEEARRVLGGGLFDQADLARAIARAIRKGDTSTGQLNFIRDLQAFRPRTGRDVPRDIEPALVALGRCLDGVADGTPEQAGDADWRRQQVSRLTACLEELAARLTAAPVRHRSAHPDAPPAHPDAPPAHADAPAAAFVRPPAVPVPDAAAHAARTPTVPDPRGQVRTPTVPEQGPPVDAPVDEWGTPATDTGGNPRPADGWDAPAADVGGDLQPVDGWGTPAADTGGDPQPADGWGTPATDTGEDPRPPAPPVGPRPPAPPAGASAPAAVPDFGFVYRA
ncbi:hypothetical protein [Streptomyces sp. NPDC018610]|uniref:hypothetical protein n=1 Tax=Streptomyces sp. NPDC018610 TaxID=3365049 RepID=UPI0037AD9F92